MSCTKKKFIFEEKCATVTNNKISYKNEEAQSALF